MADKDKKNDDAKALLRQMRHHRGSRKGLAELNKELANSQELGTMREAGHRTNRLSAKATPILQWYHTNCQRIQPDDESQPRQQALNRNIRHSRDRPTGEAANQPANGQAANAAALMNHRPRNNAS